MNSYKYLHIALHVLVGLEIVAGLTSALICEYTKHFLLDNIFQIDKHEVLMRNKIIFSFMLFSILSFKSLNVVLVVQVYELHVSICFVGGIFVIFLFKDVYTQHLKVCTTLWILLSIETIFGAIFVTKLFSDTMNYVKMNFEESLQYGIKLYESDPQWMLIFDNLQYNYMCCGIYNYTDWRKIKLSTDHEESVIKLANQLILLPYSCAKNDVQSNSNENIHSKGCFYVISDIIDIINESILTISGFMTVDVVIIVLLKSLNLASH